MVREVSQPRRARLRDVAAMAGVHPSTASRVLSGARGTSPVVAARVRRAAAKLDYRVHPIARALRGQRTGTIGVVVPDIINPFFPALCQAIERTLREDGRTLFLCDADGDPTIERSRVSALVDQRVDGLIISPVHRRDSADAILFASARMPVVQLDRRCDDAMTDFVGVDQADGIGQVFTHLVGIGSRRIVFVGSDASISPVADRMDAYERLERLAGSTPVVYRGDLSVAWGMQSVDLILGDFGHLPDAIACANDLIALGAMKRLRTLGYSVPGDVAVTGYDDTEFSVLSEPELTTVRQPIGQMAQEAIRILDDRLDRPLHRADTRLTLRPELVVRASSERFTNDGIDANADQSR